MYCSGMLCPLCVLVVVGLRQCVDVGIHLCSVALWRGTPLHACMLWTEPGARHAQAIQGAAVARRRPRSPAPRRTCRGRAGARGRRARRGGRGAGAGVRPGAWQRRGAERRGRGPRAPQPCLAADPEELAKARAGACEQQRRGTCAGCGRKPCLLMAPDVLTAASSARGSWSPSPARAPAGTHLAAAWGGARGSTRECALVLGRWPGLEQRCLWCHRGVLSCRRLGTGQHGGQHGGSCHPRCRHGLIEQTHDRRQRKHLQLCAGGTAAPACTCSVKHWPGSVETSGVQCRKIEPVMPHMRPDVSCMPFLSAKIYDDDDHIDSAHKT